MRRSGVVGESAKSAGVGRAGMPGTSLASTFGAALVFTAVLLLGAGPLVRAAGAEDALPTPDLRLTAAPGMVKIGGAATLTATIGFPDAALEVSALAGGTAAFTPVGTVVTGADGSVSLQVAPRRTTTYRVWFAGDGAWSAATAEVTVEVEPHVAFIATRSLYSGQSIVFRVATKPRMPGATLELQVLRDGDWVRVRGIRLDRRSRAVVRMRARRLGSHRYRVVLPAGASFAAGLSRTRAVTVKKGNNPYGIPVGPPHFIVVDRSQYRLYYHEHGQVVRVFNCVLGRPGLPTPLGRFRVWSKGVNPGGPFGVRVLWYYRGYGIHGTDQPWLLDDWPRAYSHGCTRLSNANALWLFDRCPIGTPVWNVP